MQQVLLATNNAAKVERFRRLILYTGLPITLTTPHELGIEAIDIAEDGDTLEENAIKKVRAYAGCVSLPILGNDTGFFVEGEGMVDAPKRLALSGLDVSQLTVLERGERMKSFWKGIATKYGGSVDAAWIESFAVLYPNGRLNMATSRREVVLTDDELGPAHPEFPVRALYYSKVTGKPAALHTPEEERMEMQPVIAAFKEIFSDLLQ